MYKYTEWTPLEADNTYEYISAGVWNREMKFDKSVFPTSIKVGGNEILYSPVELNAEFGDIKGIWEKHQVVFHEKNYEKAVYTVTQTAENLIVNADITIEFDGFVKVDFRLIPFWGPHWVSQDNIDNKPRLTKLYIDIPVKNEYAGLMHYWPNCDSGVCLSGNVINSHATPEGITKFAFKPYMWTGWEYGGLGICCESDKNFEINNPDECMTIEKHKDYTNIRIHILDDTPKDWKERYDVWGDNINLIAYSFAFQATPVKQFENTNLREWRAVHIGGIQNSPVFDEVKGNGDTIAEKIAGSGANWIILHEDWTVIQNYGLPKDEKIFKRFVRDCHKLGLKVMVYFGYEVSTLYPGFNDVYNEYLNKNLKGNTVGGWQRSPMQRDYTVCYNSGYSDVMIKRVEHVMDEYGVDGIYTDGTYVPWECANEAHGCGYRDAEGNLHFTYPVFAVREHVKKMYKAVHSRGGRIDTHQSSCCLMATLGFVDSYYDGENIQSFLQSDLRNMKSDAFRTEFMGLNMGIPCNFISYTNKNFTMRMLAGITLIHNVFPRANKMENVDFMANIWRIYDEFGTETADWYPYYEKQDIKIQNEYTYLSYYKKGDEVLLIITSHDKDLKEIQIELDDVYTKSQNMLDESTVTLAGNRLSMPVNYADVNIVKITK